MLEIKYISVGATAVLIILLILLELRFPARAYDAGLKKRSYITNFLIFIFNNAVSIGLQASIVFTIVSMSTPSVDYFSALPFWLQGVSGVIILDFGIWVWHMLNHKISVL
jgi:sterol desaturase/sphingolipid hydroxylase (fatty acid hydroxylase superfamily)